MPLFISRDNRYFQDTYQGIPRNGYTALFEKLLCHPNIKLLLNTSYREVEHDFSSARIVFTGAIDEYFDYAFGELPYRSLKFDFQQHPIDSFQELAVVNYPNDHSYTRILEFKKFSGQIHPTATTIAFEYPERYQPGLNEPYYPIPREQNRSLYESYLGEASKLKGKVLFAGRLADYKYYNMDQAVGHAPKSIRRHRERTVEH